MLEGFPYCYNEGCDVLGQLKDVKVCPQCKIARYCGEACQQRDWTTGGQGDVLLVKAGKPDSTLQLSRAQDTFTQERELLCSLFLVAICFQLQG